MRYGAEPYLIFTYTDRIGKNEIRFSTKDYHPFNIITELSTLFPKNYLLVSYASEDIGYNAGLYSIKNGDITARTDFADGSERARRFSSFLYQEDRLVRTLEERKARGV